MQCVFIHGPAASGKLTVARAVCRRSGLRLFHNHYAVDAALSLFEFGSPGFVTLRERIWLTAFEEAAAAGQSFVFTFHPEASVPGDFVEKAVAIVEGSGGRVFFVSLTCSEAVVESRIAADSRTAYRKLTSLEQYRTLRDAGAFDFPSLPEPALTLATDALTPDQAAERIIDALGLGDG